MNFLQRAIWPALLFLPVLAFTQSKFPYQFYQNRDAALLGIGGTITAGGVVFHFKNQPFTQAQVNALDRNNIRWGFDRRVTYNWSPAAAKTSDWLMISSVMAPAALCFSDRLSLRRHGSLMAVMGLETLLLADGLTNLVKNTALRPRPYAYNPDVPMSIRTQAEARRSFFSGHTSTVAALTFFSAQVYADLYPSSKWRYAVWGGAVALPAATAFYRVKAGKHFPTDVVVGYAVGALSGVLVPYLHRKK